MFAKALRYQNRCAGRTHLVDFNRVDPIMVAEIDGAVKDNARHLEHLTRTRLILDRLASKIHGSHSEGRTMSDSIPQIGPARRTLLLTAFAFLIVLASGTFATAQTPEKAPATITGKQAVEQVTPADPLASDAAHQLLVGIAEIDITPPIGFPMAGYYHERLADGAIDPLKARAVVFKDGQTEAAFVVCDLIGIATDLSRAVRKRVSEKTGIPASNIVISATHSHTAPDYMKELYLKLGGEKQDPLRAEYIEKLIDGPVDAIVQARSKAKAVTLASGTANQQIPVSFNRRFVMRDGSVRTWMNHENPDVVRAAGPIDSEISLLSILDETGKPTGVLSNFALHLDTVGGMKWSADYPFFIEQALRKANGPGFISLFGTGCCGDINHSDPRRRERNKSDFIGTAIGESIQNQLSKLQPLNHPGLVVKSKSLQLPLQDATEEEVTRSTQIVLAARRKEKVEFLEHVTAYKKLMLDHFRHKVPYAKTPEFITWGLSRSLGGIGDTLPVDVTVMTLGRDVAIVFLPGEVFVELGLAIKQASPFRTTFVIELSNCVETIYLPNRAAYAGGSYEVTNSATQSGSGEILVETAVSLLREAATAQRPSIATKVQP
jgi:neutral ceramidase